MNINEWHRRFTIQAIWTSKIRDYLFKKAGLNKSNRVLEIGCGTGAILKDIKNVDKLHGLDIDYDRLNFAKKNIAGRDYLTGNAIALPYKNNSFDITYCHYLLLWLSDPLTALKELSRVTKRGGYIIAIAEPNYRNRVDEPDEFIQIGALQTQSLITQGANPFIGEMLMSMFHDLQITDIESGILDNDYPSGFDKGQWESEWDILEYDLKNLIGESALANLKHIDLESRESGTRKQIIPTHFAIGVVSK